MKSSVSRRTFVTGAGIAAAGAVMAGALTGCGSGGSGGSGGAASAASAEKKEYVQMNLTYTTFQAEDAVGNGSIKLLQQKIDEKMEGCIQFELYCNGTLAKNADTLDAIISGVADAGFVQPSLYPGRLNAMGFFDQPGFAWSCTQAASYSARDLIADIGIEEFGGAIPLLFTVGTPGCIATTKKVETLDDLSGMAIRTTSSTTAALQALGGNPVTLEWSECYEALRSGLVDGLYTMPGPCGMIKAQEIAPYCFFNPFYCTSYVICMNAEAFNAMPEFQQQEFMALVNEVQDEYTSKYSGQYEIDPPALEYLKGVELVFPDDATREEMTNRLAPVIEEYAASHDSSGLKGTEILEKIKALAEKYNKQYPADDYAKYLQSLI